MAALSRVSGFCSLSINMSADVDSEKRATYQKAIESVISFATGTGAGGDDADMVYFREIALSASAGAASLDLSALPQAGNTMNFVRPKYIGVIWLSGSGTFFLDRGATNGYTGFPADGVSIYADRKFAFLPCTVSTSGSDKTLDYSETAGATVTALVVVIGSSA